MDELGLQFLDCNFQYFAVFFFVCVGLKLTDELWWHVCFTIYSHRQVGRYRDEEFKCPNCHAIMHTETQKIGGPLYRGGYMRLLWKTDWCILKQKQKVECRCIIVFWPRPPNHISLALLYVHLPFLLASIFVFDALLPDVSHPLLSVI